MAIVVGRGGSFASDPAGDPALRALGGVPLTK